jgi:hypothetical protein
VSVKAKSAADLRVVAQRQAFRRALGQVMGFVDDEHGVRPRPSPGTVSRAARLRGEKT